MVTFNLELFNKLLFSLQALIKTNICFYNENFESTFACTGPLNELCRLVRISEKARSRCKETDYNALTHCKCDACPDHHYFCHFGMKEMGFKMENHNETYGYIIVGPFKDSQNQAEVLQNIEKKKLTAFIDEKVAEFNNYSYKIEAISEKTCWVIVACNEEDAREDAEVFVNLLKRIATKVNKGYWEGCFSQIGEHRYKIKNDPLSLTYQYDTLFGIVIEYKKGTPMNILLNFLHNTAQIQSGVK